MTTSDIDVETETEALEVKERGYYDMFNVVDLTEVALLVMHHMQTSEFANVSAGIGGGFKNTKELKVMIYKEGVNGPDGVCCKQKLKTSINKWLQARCLKWCCARICQRARRLSTAFGQ